MVQALSRCRWFKVAIALFPICGYAISGGAEQRMDVAPMIVHPKPGSTTCPDTTVSATSLTNPAHPACTYVLDGRVIDVPRELQAEFYLDGLSFGEHSLKLALFDSDPADESAKILYQHWIVFFVDTSACLSDPRSVDDNEGQQTPANRYFFAIRQLNNFVFTPFQLARKKIEVPPDLLEDKFGVFFPAWLHPPSRKGIDLNVSHTRIQTIPSHHVNDGPDEDLLEVASILTALERHALSAGEEGKEFVFMDVGAAWGRQALRAIWLGIRLGIRVRTVAIEAEPTHFAWMEEIFRINTELLAKQSVEENPGKHLLLHGAVGWRDGMSRIAIGDPHQWWGQSLQNEDDSDWETADVKMWTLQSLFANETVVDLAHFDVQDAEFPILSQALADGSLWKMRAVYIGTHSFDGHWRLVGLFCRAGWHSVAAFEPESMGHSVYQFYEHTWTVQDGVQVWLNPHRIDVWTELGAAQPVACEGFSNVWTPGLQVIS